MPSQPATRIPSTGATLGPSVKDETTERALSELRESVDRVRRSVKAFDVVTADLASGLNKVPHKLGRPCSAALVSPSVAAADFAYVGSDQSANNARDRIVHVTLSGTAQPGAVLLVY